MDLVMEMNWMLIIILLAVSSVVAYIGDIVGMRFGKKRISIFGLRPRATSSLITVVSGILITILTLAVLSATSQTVRTAIFSMKFVQKQITELTSQLQGSRTELVDLETRLLENQKDLVSKQLQLASVEGRLERSETRLREIEEELGRAKTEQEVTLASLEELENERLSLEKEVDTLKTESQRLREGLEYIRGGRIVVFAGEMIAQTVVLPASPGTIRNSEVIMENLLREARSTIAIRYGVKAEEVRIWIGPESVEEIKNCCNEPESRKILRLIASENTVQGEMIAAEASAHESKIIYERGHVLARETGLPGSLSPEEAEGRLYAILTAVNTRAKSDGVLPDPLRGTVGNLGASDFFEAVDSLSGRGGESTVVIRADSDVYSEGPVHVAIQVIDE
jgi:uncharacterized protein (DUF3084 family)